MKLHILFLFILLSITSVSFGQIPTDYLPKEFHKQRREILRSKMPKNSIAVVFSNPIKTRANDVDYVFHQDPNFYYLTGFREPNAVLIVYSDNQKDENNNTFNEVLYVPKKDPKVELWHGKRLGVNGAKNELGFSVVKTTKDFIDDEIIYTRFNNVFVKEFQNDYRNNIKDKVETYDLIHHFKENTTSSNLNTRYLPAVFAQMREIKTKEELKLLSKAIRISVIGQIEVMKAMKPHMSETEIQGIHEFVFKKYGAEYEGYPSIVGSGNNGCILHYVDNNRVKINNDLVLMDIGAEYRGYSADVTRTIPASGKFSPEQKAIYNIVLKAQIAGVKACIPENSFWEPGKKTREIINDGLADLGIISSPSEKHNYFPHGSSHHIGLDVHDATTYGDLKENMVITVEPGIYIPEGSNCDKKWWGIAIRIEDDILITNTNTPINLSEGAPKTVDEIEKMMATKSALDDFLLPNLDD